MDKNYSFNGQRPGEKVVDIAYSHPYILYPAGLRSMFLLVAAVAVILFWPKLYFIPIILFVVTIVYFLNAYYSFKESILLITNQRILSIEQRGFFNREISEADLFKILDITSTCTGLAKTLLKFGNINVQVSGAKEKGDIVIKNISNPYYYQQVMTRLMQKQQDEINAPAPTAKHSLGRPTP